MYKLIFFIILFFILYKFFYKNVDTFNIVGYNSFKLPSGDLDTVNFTNDLQRKLMNIPTNIDLDFNVKNYLLINNNLTFPLDKIFKDYILNYLRKHNIYANDNIYIQGKIENIYFKDENNIRTYIFMFNLVNSTLYFSANIKIKLIINNISLFLDNSRNDGINYPSYINTDDNLKNQLISNMFIKGINLSSNNKFNIPQVDKLYPDYYQIKNTLYLMDPFITSGKDMYITDDMKKSFNKLMTKKSAEAQALTSQSLSYISSIGNPENN